MHRSILEIDIYVYANQIVDDVLHCKGGVQECNVDALHACAAHYYENDENNLGKFFLCMMASGNQICDGEKVTEQCA